jgi:hypothetical protein
VFEQLQTTLGKQMENKNTVLENDRKTGNQMKNRWKTDRKYGKQRKRRGKRLENIRKTGKRTENKENIDCFVNG